MAREPGDAIEVKERGINANSILLLILMGISSWVLINQVVTGQNITAIKTAQQFFKETLDKVEARMVSKPEMDSEVLKMRLKQVEFENKVLLILNDPKNKLITTPGAHQDDN